MASFGLRDLAEAVRADDTSFDTRVADNTTNRLDVPGTYPFNIGRHRLLENGTFIEELSDLSDPNAFTDLQGKFQVTATAGDEHVFGSREKVRYVPNYELLWGCAAWAESALVDGQHFAIELSNDDASEGYRYHYEGTPNGVTLTVEQLRAGSPIDSSVADIDNLQDHGFDHTRPSIARDTLNWYGGGESKFSLSHPIADAAGEVVRQSNKLIGRTANRDGVATDEINLRVQIRVWCLSGAPDLTINTCSMGALIRGNATEFNREKPPVHWDIGGSISQYPTDNVAEAIAARIDPDRRQVVAKILPPKFSPAGSGVSMGLQAIAVHKDNPDLSVNFADPDDDGTDEGSAVAAQSNPQTDAMQWTRAVSSIPTQSGIRADATEGLIPDGRLLTVGVSESGGGIAPGISSVGGGTKSKRLIFPHDVVIYLPRTSPSGSTTSGEITWLKTPTEQDW